jgi:hypothetical protein
MSQQYFKRYRMSCDLQQPLPAAVLPAGYAWVSWHAGDVDRHAQVKYEAFRDELDADVFDCLASPHGCRQLMRDIAQQPGFLPEATWMVMFVENGRSVGADCGTIQGIAATDRLGAIQNVGVVPEHRGQGLGRALVCQALKGFRAVGLARAYLEVTAANRAAVELYRSCGFRISRTMYRAIELQELPVLDVRSS